MQIIINNKKVSRGTLKKIEKYLNYLIINKKIKNDVSRETYIEGK